MKGKSGKLPKKIRDEIDFAQSRMEETIDKLEKVHKLGIASLYEVVVDLERLKNGHEPLRSIWKA
jgi:hypothetical protein